MNENWKPDLILLGPGGVKGFLILGCLKRLFQESNFLNNINTWVGISVGSAISLLIVIGYTVEEIIDICLDVNLIEDILSINLDEAKQKLGFLQNRTVEDTLKKHIILKYDYIPTLAQLYALTGINLTLVASNIDQVKPIFLNKDTHPDLSCIEAAMMSMAVPILMQPRKYKGCTYIDGAVCAPYPIFKFDKDDKKILGMYISSEEDLYSSEKKITSFVYKLIQASMKNLRDIEIERASSNVKHIPLKTNFRDTTGLSIDRESRRFMIDQGYKCGEEFLKILQNPEKYQIELQENEEIPFNE